MNLLSIKVHKHFVATVSDIALLVFMRFNHSIYFSTYFYCLFFWFTQKEN